ncbi:hypothetical protein NKW57_00750 [Acetobacter cerevisiae]|nr:hypothetical protein [Acetobacter cerevisiae]
MLLFPGVPRRDTKPLAKALINQFGSLADVLEAAPEALKAAGATRGNVALLGLVPLAADRLGAPEEPVRVDLGSWDKLLAYCATHLVTAGGGRSMFCFWIAAINCWRMKLWRRRKGRRREKKVLPFLCRRWSPPSCRGHWRCTPVL